MSLKTKWKAFQKFIQPYKQQLRAFVGWSFGMLAQVTVVGADVVMTWDTKRWCVTLGIAALPGIMGFMRGGETNPTDEELFNKVQTVKAAKKAALGVETTGEIPILPAPPK
jgi:hypothetical protein